MDFYLIQLRENSVILYTEGERLDPKTQPQSQPNHVNPLDRLLALLSARKGRMALFLKNLIIFIRDSYYKLEHKIDPMERVFKSLRHASRVQLFYSPQLSESAALQMFERLLIRQKKKHTFWTGVDLIFSLAAFLLSPFLVPIPGPNFFLYYPALRTISHFLARKGATHGLKLQEKTLLPLPEISTIEAILSQQPPGLRIEKISILAQKLKLEQLPKFLEKYS